MLNLLKKILNISRNSGARTFQLFPKYSENWFSNKNANITCLWNASCWQMVEIKCCRKINVVYSMYNAGGVIRISLLLSILSEFVQFLNFSKKYWSKFNQTHRHHLKYLIITRFKFQEYIWKSTDIFHLRMIWLELKLFLISKVQQHMDLMLLTNLEDIILIWTCQGIKCYRAWPCVNHELRHRHFH